MVYHTNKSMTTAAIMLANADTNNIMTAAEIVLANLFDFSNNNSPIIWLLTSQNKTFGEYCQNIGGMVEIRTTNEYQKACQNGPFHSL